MIFAYHGYPWLIHRLAYRRRNHANLHVRGYKEEGTVTTPFDMVIRNDLDRFHLVIDVIDRVPGLGSHAASPVSTWRTNRCAPGRTRASTARMRKMPGLDVAGPDRGTERMRVLVLNPGSSNLKASLVSPPDRARSIFDRTIDWAGSDPRGGALETVEAIVDAAGPPIDAVGYRVVHGGERFTGPARLDDDEVAAIEALADLAHSTIPSPSPRSGLPVVCSPMRRMWPRSTLRSTRPCRSPPDATRSRATGPTPSTGTGSMGCPSTGPFGGGHRELLAQAGRLAGSGRRPSRRGGCSVTAVDGGRSVDTSMGKSTRSRA